ncbi:hypothetical protein AAFF_G00341810 [Aldrovandia affinis]|uniref:Uncharacterized protein n=1 Tax=Aldrovandia affinis TaxID=143900 RepID=A0AAD7SKZ2_9TELE|nr:hypothetical protein AAFF_G00341810 [Aldrovandia affinis]
MEIGSVGEEKPAPGAKPGDRADEDDARQRLEIIGLKLSPELSVERCHGRICTYRRGGKSWRGGGEDGASQLCERASRRRASTAV